MRWISGPIGGLAIHQCVETATVRSHSYEARDGREIEGDRRGNEKLRVQGSGDTP